MYYIISKRGLDMSIQIASGGSSSNSIAIANDSNAVGYNCWCWLSGRWNFLGHIVVVVAVGVGGGGSVVA